MIDLTANLLIVLRGIWRRRWIGVAAAWLAGIGGLVALAVMPIQYEASARIFVDTDSVLKPLMRGLTVELNTDQQIAMLGRTLITRPTIERVIAGAELDRDLTTRGAREALVESLMNRVQIASAPTSREARNLFTLSFRDTEQARAKRVIEVLTSIFLESSRGENRQDSAQAKAFIEEQIKAYEKKLSEAENKLKEFRMRHLGVAEGGETFFTRMHEASTRLNEARLELRQAEHARDALKRQLSGEDPALSGTLTEVSDIDSRIDAVRRNLDTLLQRFTEEHPDVAGARRVLAQLEAQKKREEAEREKAGTGRAVTPTTANPVYQRLKVSLAEAEANVASLRTRLAEYEERHRQLKESARLVPEIEADMAQLNRDYEVNKKNYEALVARRESAEILGEMGTVAGVANFRVIDPPRVSPRPVTPSPLLLAPLVLLGSLGAGIAASFAASRVWPTFSEVGTLRKVSGLPVIGTVSFRTTEESRKRERAGRVVFFASLGGLVVFFGVAAAIMLSSSMRAF